MQAVNLKGKRIKRIRTALSGDSSVKFSLVKVDQVKKKKDVSRSGDK